MLGTSFHTPTTAAGPAGAVGFVASTGLVAVSSGAADFLQPVIARTIGRRLPANVVRCFMTVLLEGGRISSGLLAACFELGERAGVAHALHPLDPRDPAELWRLDATDAVGALLRAEV